MWSSPLAAVTSQPQAYPAVAQASDRQSWRSRAAAAATPLSTLLQQWQAGSPARLEDLWESLRAALQAPPQGLRQEEAASAQVQLFWDAITAGTRASGLREAVALPCDIARGLVGICSRHIEAQSGTDEPQHAVLRLLALSLPDAGAQGHWGDSSTTTSSTTRSTTWRLAALLRRTTSLRTSSLALQCLARVAELAPALIQASSQEATEGVLASARCLNTNLLQGKVTSVSALRDAGLLLQALVPVVNELKAQLEPSALALLASLQPSAVVGAPYVVRGQHAAARGVVAGLVPPSATSSGTEYSELDQGDSSTSSRPRATGKMRGGGGEEDVTGAMASQAAQCRTSGLRAFVQLFRLYPKAFFGRWSLVLDFQSGEVVRATAGGGAPLPLMLAICQQDPSPKVRAAGLAALCALLEAPGVRNFPVPLERGGPGASSSRAGGGSFTSLADQVATTLRQSHAVVLGLLQRGGPPLEMQSALRACGDLLGCTPYAKLQPGLLAAALRSLLPSLKELSTFDSLDMVSQNASISIVVLGAALKRDDCADELGAALYGVAEGSAAPLADELLALALHVARLAQAHGAAPPPGSPSGSSRRARGGRGGGARGGGGRGSTGGGQEAEGGEPAVSIDTMAAMARLASLRSRPLPASTRRLFQQLVEALLEQSGSSLRARGFRVLEDLLTVRSAQGAAEAGTKASPDALSRAGVDMPEEWCAKIALRALAMLPAEPSHLVRVAALEMLPGAVMAVRGGTASSAAGAAGGLASQTLAAARAGMGDSNATVRTAAAQACGALATLWAQPAGDSGGGGGAAAAVLELLLALFVDPAADARSAAVTAAASLASAWAEAALAAGATDPTQLWEGAGQRPRWGTAIQGALLLGADRPEKPRASALRGLGFLAEVVDLQDGAAEDPGGTTDGGSGPTTERAPLPATVVPATPAMATIPAPLGMPPGMAPPGLDICTGYCATRADEAHSDEPLLLRLARGLAQGVRTPPPKCQWNACRAIGQVYQSASFARAPHCLEAHQLLLRALCEGAAAADNMKVRIQAVQALTQLPLVPRFWTLADADSVLVALCEALGALGEQTGGKRVEDRQRALYAGALRTELRGLGEHWAACAPATAPGASGQEAIRAAAPALEELLLEAQGQPYFPASAAVGFPAPGCLAKRLEAVLGPGPWSNGVAKVLDE